MILLYIVWLLSVTWSLLYLDYQQWTDPPDTILPDTIPLSLCAVCSEQPDECGVQSYTKWRGLLENFPLSHWASPPLLTVVLLQWNKLLMMPGISQWRCPRSSPFTLGWPVEWLYGGCWWARIWPSTTVLHTLAWCAASEMAAFTCSVTTCTTVRLSCIGSLLAGFIYRIPVLMSVVYLFTIIDFSKCSFMIVDWQLILRTVCSIWLLCTCDPNTVSILAVIRAAVCCLKPGTHCCQSRLCRYSGLCHQYGRLCRRF